MRIMVFILAFTLVVLSGFLVCHYYQNASNARKDLDQERYNKIIAEENLEKASTRVNSLETELSRTKSKIESIEKLLEQTKSINNDLKSQIDNISQTKVNLEDKIQKMEQITTNATVSQPAATN